MDETREHGSCWADRRSVIERNLMVACGEPAVDDLELCAAHRAAIVGDRQ